MLAIYKRELRAYFQSMVGSCVRRVSYRVYRHLFHGVQPGVGISVFFVYTVRVADRVYRGNTADHYAELSRRRGKIRRTSCCSRRRSVSGKS